MHIIPLIIIFILLEIALLIELGAKIGTFHAIVWLVLSALFGWLVIQNTQNSARQKVKRDIMSGRMPTGSLFQSLLLMIAGVLLIVPGLITDAAGLILLLPITRNFLTRRAAKSIDKFFNYCKLPFFRKD